ncbi:MAG: substrate-binding domain-containing protein, partial [Proteobacteria bacterium]|nr:substrate-binding domain-containing protein [Pseudomonadota bacterium]
MFPKKPLKRPAGPGTTAAASQARPSVPLAARLAGLAAALLVLGGSPARADQPVTIFAAASTMEAVNAVVRAYEAGGRGAVRPVFAASSTLALQIARGAPADLFLSANTAWIIRAPLVGPGVLTKAVDYTVLIGDVLKTIVIDASAAARTWAKASCAIPPTSSPKTRFVFFGECSSWRVTSSKRILRRWHSALVSTHESWPKSASSRSGGSCFSKVFPANSIRMASITPPSAERRRVRQCASATPRASEPVHRDA